MVGKRQWLKFPDAMNSLRQDERNTPKDNAKVVTDIHEVCQLHEDRQQRNCSNRRTRDEA